MFNRKEAEQRRASDSEEAQCQLRKAFFCRAYCARAQWNEYKLEATKTRWHELGQAFAKASCAPPY
jgi:hypothetical protein